MFKSGKENFHSGDFEKIINEHWSSSPYNDWTRSNIFIYENIVSFALYHVNAIPFCNHDSVILPYGHNDKYLVQESVCKLAKNQYVRLPSCFDIKVCNRDTSIKMILEFNFDFSVETPMASYSFDAWKLKFMKLSHNTIAPTRATKGSVGYDVYSAVYRLISSSECELVAMDIPLISSPGVYPWVAPRSSMTLKNTNVGVSVIDIDYRGNLKVLIMIHSSQNTSILNRETKLLCLS